jgi:polar amino acid transport system permease protein
MTILAATYGFSWHIFWQYLWPPSAFHNPLIVQGIIATVYMSVLAQVLGVILGLIGALLQMSSIRPLRALVRLYVLYFRGIPVLVELSLLYFGFAALGIYSFKDIHILGLTIPGVIIAGIVGLGLKEGAYMTEITRAGILSIEHGQSDAAKSIGMTFGQSMRYVILPQAARVIIPPLGNEFNAMLKDTTLVTVIGGTELFNAYEQINGVIFRPFELFLAVSLYYVSFTAVWTVIQDRLEAKFGAGDVDGRERLGLTKRWLTRDRRGVTANEVHA